MKSTASTTTGTAPMPVTASSGRNSALKYRRTVSNTALNISPNDSGRSGTTPGFGASGVVPHGPCPHPPGAPAPQPVCP